MTSPTPERVCGLCPHCLTTDEAILRHPGWSPKVMREEFSQVCPCGIARVDCEYHRSPIEP